MNVMTKKSEQYFSPSISLLTTCRKMNVNIWFGNFSVQDLFGYELGNILRKDLMFGIISFRKNYVQKNQFLEYS